MGVSRRQFVIRGAVACAGAGVLAAQGTAFADEAETGAAIASPGGSLIVDAPEMQWDRETEVLVIGCGGAGAAAALTAQEQGASVLVVEASNMSGGCTAYSGQAIAAGGTNAQNELGIEDSPEDFTEFLLAVGDGDEELLTLYGMHSLETYEWLEGLGMTVPAVEASPGITFGGSHDFQPEIPRTHWTDSGVWAVLDSALEDNGIEVLLETPATALITDAQTGEVVGAVAGGMAIKASKAVILAAGGFANNPDMVHQHITSGIYVSFARNTDNGDGLKLAESVGAAVSYTNSGNDAPAYADPVGACTYLIESSPVEGDPAYIAVNKQAQRFMDESNFQVPVNRSIMTQTDGVCYVITCGEAGIAGFGVNSGENAGASPDTMAQADSIAELADILGIDSGTLENTVASWNEMCAQGEDTAFGRAKTLKPLDQAPYAAMAVYPGFSGTLSSVATNVDLEVLASLTGEKIGRLYAVGSNGNCLGRQYVCCGAGVGSAITTGRIAGANAAALEAWG